MNVVIFPVWCCTQPSSSPNYARCCQLSQVTSGSAGRGAGAARASPPGSQPVSRAACRHALRQLPLRQVRPPQPNAAPACPAEAAAGALPGLPLLLSCAAHRVPVLPPPPPSVQAALWPLPIRQHRPQWEAGARCRGQPVAAAGRAAALLLQPAPAAGLPGGCIQRRCELDGCSGLCAAAAGGLTASAAAGAGPAAAAAAAGPAAAGAAAGAAAAQAAAIVRRWC